MLSEKDNLIAGEHGNIVLIALMVLMILGVLSSALVGVASMEKKMSHYALKMQQARQAADGGVDWAVDEILGELKQPENLNSESLPQTITLDSPEITIGEGQNAPKATISSIQLAEDPTTYSCKYTFYSTGEFSGIKKKLKVEVKYFFENCYDIDGQFMNRAFTAEKQGIITYYREVVPSS